MKETRKITRDNLRALCIEKDWYTRGNSEEYAEMLYTAESISNLTSEDIVMIATDILEHSVTEHPLSSICFEIARKCYSFFE